MSGLFKTWHRKRTLRRYVLDEALWQHVTRGLPFLHGLTDAEWQRLKDYAVLFLDEKEMSGARGFIPGDAVRLSIAVQACLPILHLGLDAYQGWIGIVIYPGEFKVRREEMDASGVVHEYDDALSGEAWRGGPVILSWEDIKLGAAGYNVVIHEFAHKLHMVRGDMDDFPLPHAHMDRGPVAERLGCRLRRILRRGRPRHRHLDRPLCERAAGGILRRPVGGLFHHAAGGALEIPGTL